jgi:hypothetical protein
MAKRMTAVFPIAKHETVDGAKVFALWVGLMPKAL